MKPPVNMTRLKHDGLAAVLSRTSPWIETVQLYDLAKRNAVTIGVGRTETCAMIPA